MNKQEKKKCYISGKITGLPNEVATQNFREASLHARFLGYEPVNPMNIVSDTEEPKSEKDKWSWYMKADLKEMMDCDAILMQDNWRDSKGAIVEHNLAKELGFIIMYIGKHKSVEIGNNFDYQRHDLLVDKKEDKKIGRFLFYLAFTIFILYCIYNSLFIPFF
jgi:hypothetical protein